ncbi:protein turtle homolog A-like [Brevipalpus obovatus]|uniref:protein turtle homolog A-like n=1 Tax=Brevipalpus obovatus TaxID=246614 RepID=UPI003D9E0DC5
MTILCIPLLLMAFNWSFKLTNGDEQTIGNVFGVAGGKVALPCNITPPTSDDAVSLILWYKDESTTPIYSLDARKGSLDQARHASSDQLNSRIHMNTVQKPSVLWVQSLHEEDGGEYRCRVDFKKARTRNFVVFLKIIVPPDKPIIRDAKNSEPLTSLIGPFNEGDKLSLICEVSGGKPRPSVTWWRESVLLDDSSETLATGTIRNRLDLDNLQRHDLMAVLTCQASNNNISIPQVSSVTVDLNFRPLTVGIQGENKPFSAGKATDVICKTAGSRPAPTITWWIGSNRLKKSREKHSLDGNVTTSILTFKPTADDTGKHITCRAENPLIPESVLEDSWKLTVHYVPQLSLRLGNKLRHSHIQAGNDVYFECNIRSSPWVTEVRWWFEGKELHTNTSAGIIVSNQSLVLQRVQRSNRGRYTCTARNTQGEGESNPVHLRVQFLPSCKPGQKVLYGAARMESVKIKCELESDPSDVTFTWSFNNSNENMHITNHIAEGASSTVTYRPKTEYDYGTLFCWGSNSIGAQREPCIFTVIPAGPPDPIRNCSIVNRTEDSVRVDCVEGYDGGLMQHFVMEVYPASALIGGTSSSSTSSSFASSSVPSSPAAMSSGSSSPSSAASSSSSSSSSSASSPSSSGDSVSSAHQHMIIHQSNRENSPQFIASMLISNLTSNWPSWIAYGLPSGTELSLNLYAVNSKGRSRSEVFTIATASLPESANRLARGQVWQFSFSPFLAILITVVSVIVIIALLIIMILKMCPDSPSRNRRKKKNEAKRNKHDKCSTPLRKSVEEFCDVCSCGVEPDDKCPDIIPEMSLNSQAPLSKNDEDVDSLCCEKLKTHEHCSVPSNNINNLISTTPTSEMDHSHAHLIPLNSSTPLSSHHHHSHSHSHSPHLHQQQQQQHQQTIQLVNCNPSNCLPQSELTSLQHDFYPPPPPLNSSPLMGGSMIMGNGSSNHHLQQFNTLQYPKRVQVVSTNSATSIRSTDDINSHLHTVV